MTTKVRSITPPKGYRLVPAGAKLQQDDLVSLIQEINNGKTCRKWEKLRGVHGGYVNADQNQAYPYGFYCRKVQ